MKIHHVEISNWEPPGEEWWDRTQAAPGEPLIEAMIAMTLSWDEYSKLLAQSKMQDIQENTHNHEHPHQPLQ